MREKLEHKIEECGAPKLLACLAADMLYCALLTADMLYYRCADLDAALRELEIQMDLATKTALASAQVISLTR